MKRSLILFVLTGLLPVLVLGAEASEGKGPRDLIEAYRAWKLADVLDLSDEDMPVFFARLKRIEERDAELRRDEREAIQDIAHLLGKEDVAEGDLEKALARYHEIRQRRMEELRSLRDEAFSMLTLRQRCQYVVFEDRFKTELRQMIGRVKEFQRRGGFDERDEFGRRGEFGGMGQRRGQPRGPGRGRR